MDEGQLVLRVVVAMVMVFHGTEKLFGWWGGEGIEGATLFFARMGYRPPRVMALLAGATETIGGVSLGLGLLTALGCIMLIGALVNVLALHVRNGLSRRKNGFEYELVLLAAVVSVLMVGAGSWSMDKVIGLAQLSTELELAALGLAVLGGLAVVLSRRVLT